jgi:hypothetical protein
LQKGFSPVEHVKNTIFCVGALNPKNINFGMHLLTS